MGKITATGLGYSLKGDDEWERNSTCSEHESFSVDFTGTSSSMSGLFNFSNYFTGSDCSGVDTSREGTRVFTVNFTAQ
jgi:hypothetical protein